MKYQIDDRVIHWTFGLGKIVGIDEKTLENRSRMYYVVEAGRSTLWVPVDSSGEGSLRPPTSKVQFKELLKLLHSPGDPLPEAQYQRQSELTARMQKRTLKDVCYIIRDLVWRSRTEKLNRSDLEILKRAEGFLLDEWELSLGTSRENAENDLQSLLSDHKAAEA